jgi:RAT1-interacting protein
MTFQCLDVTKELEFDDDSFDLIVCKGTLDAILCNQNAFDKVQSMMRECHRVLDNKHGVMVVVSYGRPDDRLMCFDADQWREVKTYTVPKPMVPGMTDVGA